MRQTTIGQCNVIYPDFLIYEGDNMVITLKAADSNETTLAVTLDGKTAEYTSDKDSVDVEIGTLLRQSGNVGDVTVSVYISRANPAYSTTLSIKFYYCKGRTLPTRYHGSARTVIMPYGVDTVEVLVVDDCTVTSEEPVTLVGGQIYSVVVPRGDTSITIKYDTPHIFGDFHNAYETDEVVVDVRSMECLGDEFVAVRWLDIDGCLRYAVGRVLGRSQSADSVSYNEGVTTVRNPAHRIVAGVHEVLEVGFADISPTVHLDEIEFSEIVELYSTVTGEAVPVIVEGSIDTDMRKSADYILKFKTID